MSDIIQPVDKIMDFEIDAENLTKHYRSQKNKPPALDNLQLKIPRGQLFGLVGPDGAGKTTTIRILATVLEPTGGIVRIAGYNIEKQADKARKNIGYMPQNFSLYPDLSVIENLAFFSDIFELDSEKKKIRIEEMLEFTRLADFRKRSSGNLSGGMKKKLALACALIHEPEVLLLDEPSTGVDPVSRRELWVILAKVVQRGITVLVSTPYMDEAERCHKVGILYNGKLLTTGSPAELEAQLPFSVLELKASSRRIAREVIKDTNGILDWRPVGDRLRLSVNAPGKVKNDLTWKLRRSKTEIQILRDAKRTMEDVFMYEVETRRGEK